MAFAENASFKGCGMIFLSPSIVGFLMSSRMNSNGFFSTILYMIAADLHTNAGHMDTICYKLLGFSCLVRASDHLTARNWDIFQW